MPRTNHRKLVKYLLFTPELHQALIKYGITHLVCLGYIPNIDLDGRLFYNTPYKRNINGYAIRVLEYIPVDINTDDYAVEMIVTLPKDPEDPERIEMIAKYPELLEMEEFEKNLIPDDDGEYKNHPYYIIKGFAETPKVINPGIVGAQTSIHLQEIQQLYPNKNRRYYVIFERYPSSVWKVYKKMKKCRLAKSLFGRLLISNYHQ